MLSFKEFLKEGVIKLRGFHNHEKAQNFIQDLHDTTSKNRLNPNYRVHGKTAVEVSSNGKGGIHLHDIISHDPGSGGGSETLKHLTSLADKHGVHIEGHAKAYMDKNSDHISHTKHLKSWYQKHGFEIGKGSDSDGYPIKYHPKKVLKLGSKTRTVDI